MVTNAITNHMTNSVEQNRD